MGRGFLLALVALAGCVADHLVPCGDRLCPVGTQCVANELCANGEQLAACDGIADDAICVVGAAAGVCDRGVCVVGACGNGVVEADEACDDGNTDSGDGCRGDCNKLEACGDGVVDQGEACDDANANAVDGCDACTATTWRASTVIGGNVPATSFGLAAPDDVAVDRSGNIYVTDTNRDRVLRIDATGSVSVIAGTGEPGFSGDGGPATSAQLNEPVAVEVDGLGSVYIADNANARVRRVAPDGVITTYAGNGTVGATGDGGSATGAQLSSPQDIAIDGLGNLYIADNEAARVRRVDPLGTITTVAGTGTHGFSGDGGLATAAQLDNPSSLVIDSSGLFIADFTDARIRRVDSSGVITTIAGTGVAGPRGDGGPATAAAIAVQAIAGDGAGTLYLTDDSTVRRIAPTGTIETIAGSSAESGFSGDGGPAISALLQNPQGLALDAGGRLLIADRYNYRVRRIDTAGAITTVAGNGSPAASGDGGGGTSAEMETAIGVATDAQGNVYVADADKARVRKVAPSGVITTIAGMGTANFSGDGGPATAAELSYPQGVAVDPQGNVYIADTENDVVRRIDPNGIIHTFAGSTAGFSGDGGPATSAQLSLPYAVAIGTSGQVYIVDSGNARVRMVATDGTITTVVGTGVQGYAGDNGPATSAQIHTATGIAVDGTNLYIAEYNGNRIRKVDGNGIITTVAGIGLTGFTGDGGPATSARLHSPFSVAARQGVLYIADTVNHRVRKVDTNGVISTVAGTGVLSNTGDGGPATSATFRFVYGVTLDPIGRIVLTDTYNSRVRRIDADGTIITIAGRVDPDGTGPLAQAKLADPRELVIASAFTLFAGGVSGTVQAVRTGAAWLGTVAGRYGHDADTGALARYRDFTFGNVGGLAYDATLGVIFVSETTTNQLQVITLVDPDNENTWTIAPLPIGSFRAPTGLYLDAPMHQLYVADTGNHAIQVIDLAGGIATATVRTFAGVSATRGFYGDDSAATSALLFEPNAVTRCANGDVFIADTGNHRIRRVAAGTNVITTVLGDGVAASSGDGVPASTFPVDTPLGLACDAAGNLFVTSSTTVRLLPADASGIVDGTGAVHTIYGAAPRDTFPASVTACLTGIQVVDATTVSVVDACSGLMVKLERGPL